MTNRLLEISDLAVRFDTPEGTIHAVNGVSFSLNEGEILGIVGESGCGKTVTMLSILRLIPMPPGRIERGGVLFGGNDLVTVPENELRQVRGRRIGMIFQDPMTSLNPVMKIGKQVAEPLVEHLDIGKAEIQDQVADLLGMVGIPDPKDRMNDYPHQFSGGMRQRVGIATALACNPELLIADEPTTALDVTIQAQIVDLVKSLRDKLGMAIIWITHDLGVVAGLVERVIVLYAGYIVEQAPVKELYANPQHPYTLGLLKALPRMDKGRSERLANIEGRPPDLLAEPSYCPFAPRCAYVREVCWNKKPELRSVGDTHSISCWVDVKEEKEIALVGETPHVG
ncbi:MAG: ABC transporter ATP-binding protein [Chloroflexi bacterium]|nr:ABC transporter ATP-binding protein [Chloroflexota bacterium]